MVAPHELVVGFSGGTGTRALVDEATRRYPIDRGVDVSSVVIDVADQASHGVPIAKLCMQPLADELPNKRRLRDPSPGRFGSERVVEVLLERELQSLHVVDDASSRLDPGGFR